MLPVQTIPLLQARAETVPTTNPRPMPEPVYSVFRITDGFECSGSVYDNDGYEYVYWKCASYKFGI